MSNPFLDQTAEKYQSPVYTGSQPPHLYSTAPYGEFAAPGSYQYRGDDVERGRYAASAPWYPPNSYNQDPALYAAGPPQYPEPPSSELQSTHLSPHYAQGAADSKGRSRSPSPVPSADDEQFLDQALRFTSGISPGPSVSATSPLQSPVAIPQTAPGIGIPFARAYAPALMSHGISASTFVTFIDNLNVVATGSPPLQILDMAGGLVGMVPVHWFGLAGNLTQLVAKVGKAAVSKGRTEAYMKRTNSELFAPRGLQVRIASTAAMAEVLRVNVEELAIPPLTLETKDISIMDRRLHALQGYISPLTFEVPPPTEQTTALAKMSDKQVKFQQKQMEKKTMKGRRKALENLPGSGETKVEKEERKINQEAEEDMRKAMQEDSPRKREKEMAKVEKDRQKELRKLNKDRGKNSKDLVKDDKEIKAGRKVLWILVTSLEGAGQM